MEDLFFERGLEPKFVQIGDDILIGDPEVGEAFLKILSDNGIDFSLQKSFISSELSEFAKRVIYRDVEITGVPVSSVLDNLRSVPLLVSAIQGEAKKGFSPVCGIPAAIHDLDRLRFRGVRVRRPSTQRVRTAIECVEVSAALAVRGADEVPYGVCLRNLIDAHPWARTSKADFSDPTVVRTLWVSCCTDLFTKSVSRGFGKGAPLTKHFMNSLLAWLDKAYQEGYLEVDGLEGPYRVPEEDGGLPYLALRVRDLPGTFTPTLIWTIPVLGATSRLGASFHRTVADIEKGYGVSREN